MSCEDKQRYDSKKDALTVRNIRLHTANRRGKPKFLRAYPCDECGGWHLTKQRKHNET